MNILINDVEITYEEYGAGTPVICLHGFCVDSNIMKGCLEPVFQRHNNYRRIYLDLIGMGNTPANYSVNNSDDVLDVVANFILEVVGSSPFILVGESFGGYLSLGLIKQFESQIAGLFLICPCTVGDHRKRILPEKQILQLEKIKTSDKENSDYQSFLEMAVVVNEYTWDRYKKEIIVGIKKVDFSYIKSLPKEGYSLTDEQSFSKINFKKPATFLLGKQDHVVGYEDSLKLEPNFPRGTFAVLDSAGHNLQIEKPELFSALLEDFLKLVRIIF